MEDPKCLYENGLITAEEYLDQVIDSSFSGSFPEEVAMELGLRDSWVIEWGIKRRFSFRVK